MVGIDVRRNLDTLLLASAVADHSIGRVTLWRLAIDTFGNSASANNSVNEMESADRMGVFREHDRPVSAVVISPDGETIASGDDSGEVLIWRSLMPVPSNTAKQFNGGRRDRHFRRTTGFPRHGDRP